MNPLVPLVALGAGLAFVLSSKKSAALTPGTPTQPTSPTNPAAVVPSLPATNPPPSNAPSQTVSKNGHTWKLVTVSSLPGATTVDVFAPAGSWGPHNELLVCRFVQIVVPGNPRTLAGAGKDVPKAVLDAALKDLDIKVPGASVAPSPSTPTTPTGPAMPASLQAEMIATMAALGVDANGVVKGPVTAEAVRRATELSSRLEQAGYPQAAAAMRGYAQQGSKLLPAPVNPAPPIPGVPAEMMAQIQKALELERDPAKLETLKAALKTLPASAQRDMLIGALDALILQIRTEQAMAQAATEIEQMTAAAAAAAAAAASGGAPVPGTPFLPPYPTPAPVTGTRILKLTSPNMKGEDVRAWQLVLLSAGYNLGKAGADGVFGPSTDTATIDWQKKRGLEGDGDVGPSTRAKIGTPPTAPLGVPSTPSPRPDPAPKSQLEVAAESLATHLRALQQKHGVPGSKGKQDTTLVNRFQTAAGGSADGKPGPGTMLALARAGQGQLPAVMYWPKAATKAKDLPAYRQNLATIAKDARAKGLSTLASQIEASAAREVGAGGLP